MQAPPKEAEFRPVLGESQSDCAADSRAGSGDCDVVVLAVAGWAHQKSFAVEGRGVYGGMWPLTEWQPLIHWEPTPMLPVPRET